MKISPTFCYKTFTIKDLSSNSIEDIKLNFSNDTHNYILNFRETSLLLTVLVDVLYGMSKNKLFKVACNKKET